MDKTRVEKMRIENCNLTEKRPLRKPRLIDDRIVSISET